MAAWSGRNLCVVMNRDMGIASGAGRFTSTKYIEYKVYRVQRQ